MKLFLLWLALVSLVSVSYWATVDLPWFWEYQDWLASYAYTKCLEIKDWKDTGTYYRKWQAHTADYSCKWFVLTMNAENWGRNMKAKPRNNNGTTDNWLCQLNSAYHSKFIYSDDFQDPYKQIDYCLNVWKDAAHRSKMPRYAHEMRFKRDKWIIFNDTETKEFHIEPPLDEWVNEIKDNTYPKKECRRVWNLWENDYVQIDTRWGELRQMIFPKRKSKVFICSQ